MLFARSRPVPRSLEDLIAERPRELTLANQKLRDAAAERERIEQSCGWPRSSSRSAGSPRASPTRSTRPVQFVSDH